MIILKCSDNLKVNIYLSDETKGVSLQHDDVTVSGRVGEGYLRGLGGRAPHYKLVN